MSFYNYKSNFFQFDGIIKMVNIMNKEVEYLKKTFEGNSDFNVREIPVNKKDNVYIVFFESLCEAKSIYDFVIKNIVNCVNIKSRIENLKSVISGPKIVELTNNQDKFYYLENGFCLVFFKKEIYAVEAKASIDRGITMSETEPNMYGPKDSFCENYQKNLGIVKRRIKNKDFKVDSVEHGIYTKTKISILYLDSKINKDTLKKIKDNINKCKDFEVTDSYDLSKRLRLNKIFPTILKTEKPAVAAKYILKGYVVVLIDNTPFALILDAKFKDFINPSTTDKFIKILRYICFFLTIFTPAIYIALINFNQETIPTSLLINFSEQRSGVPFPAIIEAFIMLLICEILRETDIRFPNNYGSSASILGALVLGDAAVSAGIVSPIMIIIIAVTFITNLIFTEIKLVWGIRIMRISFLLIAGFLGLYGISIAFITCLSIMANVKLNEGTYI